MHTSVHILSINAYQQHLESGRARSQGRRILEHIRDHGGDWSIGELAAALDLDKSAVSARVHELLHDTEELVACARRKDRVSGILVRPVARAASTAAREGRGG